MEDQMAKRQLLLLAQAESLQNGLAAALEHLRDAGWQIVSAADSAEADHLLTTESPTAVLVGHGFEARSAVSWLERIQQLCVEAPVIALLPEQQLLRRHRVSRLQLHQLLRLRLLQLPQRLALAASYLLGQLHAQLLQRGGLLIL